MFKGDRNLVVGLFMTVAIAVLVTFIIWLTGRTGQEELARYTLLFDRDVSGLSLGGAVNYMGVNIGSVTSMTLEQDNGTRVRVDIEVLADTPVDSGTWASIAMQGITGVAVINLASDPGGDHAPVRPPAGRKYPVIPVRDVGFAAIVSNMGSIMGKMDQVLEDIQQILGDENQASIAGTLKNLESVTSSLAEDREAIASLPDKLDQTLTSIQATVEQLNAMANEARPDIGEALGQLKSASTNLADLTGRIDQLVAGNEQAIDQFLAEGLTQAPALMEDARNALRELDKLLRDLQDDPSQLLFKTDSNALEVDR
jgi:phospholipid/cholesterol/gamma-HCH transport system substrate-binding protein